jgi:hypothetical protein
VAIFDNMNLKDNKLDPDCYFYYLGEKKLWSIGMKVDDECIS